MKRIASIAVAVLVTASAFGQTTFDTNIRIEKADGTIDLIPTVAAPLDSVIVEFRDAPLAVAQAGKTALPDYRATFTRFRQDLAGIVNAGRAGKSTLTPEVRWEYFRVFNGASVRVSRADAAAIAALPYVKKVHTDHEMRAMAGA